MFFNKELYNKIILYIGDVEQDKSYFPIDEITIPEYSKQDIYNHVACMIEGEIIQGIFAEDELSDQYGYLIGGLTTETKYFYTQLKKHYNN